MDGMDFPETAGTDLQALASSPLSGGVVAGDEISPRRDTCQRGGHSWP